MRLESNLNERVFRESQNLNLELAIGEKVKTVKRNFFYIPVLFTLSYLFLLQDNFFGYVLIGFGLIYLINNVNYYTYYSKYKKAHLNSIEKEILYHKSNPNELIINEFRENDFYYKDYRMEFSLIWEKFESYQIKNDFLILKSFGGNYLNFFIHKSEISEKEFDKILTFVRDKINNK